MCSHDHTVMMALKLGPWRTDAVGGVLLTELSHISDARRSPSTGPTSLIATLLRPVAARLSFNKK